LRDREQAPGRNFDAPSLARRPPSAVVQDSSDDDADDANIRSNVEFLRAMEQDDPSVKKHRRSSSQSKHTKRSSLSSITSNTKNIVKGKFGDAFRMFENNNSSGGRDRDQPPLTPTDALIPTDRTGKNQLTPIAGSEATGDLSDDERAIDETQDLPPEVRRELERRRLSQEEKRVADAAAEYRRRLAEKDAGGPQSNAPTRASTIQNRVRSLLDDSQKDVVKTRTAEGYGKYTDTGNKPLPTRPQDQSGMRPQAQPPVIARKPLPMQNAQQDLAYAKPRPPIQQPPLSNSAPPAALRTATGPSSMRPSAPPKPKALRTGGPGDMPLGGGRPSPILKDKPLPATMGGGAGGLDDDFDVDSFSKRYPSLSGLEMVETEIPSRGRTRDV
jgi:AP2-associated kinase